MACGLPVIATDYPGVRAVVDDGRDRAAGAARRPGRGRGGARRAGRRRPRAARGRWASAGGAKALARVELAEAGRAHGRRLRGGDRGPAAGAAMSEPAAASCSSPTSIRPAATPACCGRRRWRSGCAGSATRSRCSPPRPTATGRATRSEDVVRTADAPALARPARRQATRSARCSTRRHLLGPPPPPQQGPRARGAGRRLDAVRALAGPAPAARAALRLRDHDLAAGVGARGRLRAAAPRRAVGRRRPRRLDLRVAASRVPDRAAQRRLDQRLERRWLGAADAVVCVSEPGGRRPAPARDRRAAADPQRLGPGGGAVDRRPRSRPVCSTPSASRSSTRAASAATAATRVRWSTALAELARDEPDAAAKLELVIAGPLTEDEAELLADRRLPGAHRPRRQPRPRERPWRFNARPTRCC